MINLVLKSLLHDTSGFNQAEPVPRSLKTDKLLANQRAEDALIAIQGALILSRGLGEIAPFQRIIQQLPAQLCQDIGG